MKRFAVLLLAILLCLCACGSGKPQTPEALIGSYLAAVAKEDYDAILGMLPEQIVEYGMEYLEGDRQDVLAFIEDGVHDYHWLAKADLPDHPDFTWKLTDVHEYTNDEVDRIWESAERDDLRLPLRGVAEAKAEIMAGEKTVEAYFFMIELGDGWYMISVTGDDEIFKY